MKAIELSAEDFSNKTFTVTELTSVIKDLLEGSFPRIILEGEISNFRPASTGHLYFTLKDNNAAISAVMFKGKSQYLNFLPCDGTLVQVRGTISVYPPRGTYQIVIDSMELAGTGNILKMLEERKRRLAAEGLFDSQKKKRLPFFPKTIGVVTSPTGAALRDILQVSGRRNPKVSFIVLPCAVQGSEAALGIAKMIQIANIYKMVDVLIVGRGGGSLEDLLPFSEECVVRAVAASEIPIVSAVGHEIDFSLSDFAADVRAPTPSAAAEIVTPLLVDIKETISSCKNDLYDGINVKLERLRLLVRSFTPESMELRFRSIEQPLLMRFDSAKEILLQAMEQKCKETRRRIENVVRDLDGANPKNILARGYSMVKDLETGKIIRSEKDTSPGHLIEITPASGKIIAKTEGAL
ncbi:MAG: exodeoxyribonuclease VII large subunit [Spirochaetaceae bacterium]|nr:exodeoxyribonuclease VII large subunit [Spirochaetaceae bacterium]